MHKNNLRKGLNAGRIFRRRLWILLVIGLVHAFVFWFGDELHKCALLGFSLPYFYDKSVKTILRWIAGLALLVILFQVFSAVYFNDWLQNYTRGVLPAERVISEMIDVWKSGTVINVLSMQWLGVVMLFIKSVQSGLSDLAQYEIMCLLGIVAGKLNAPGRLNEFRLTLAKLGLWLFPVALLMKAISCLPDIGLTIGLGQFVKYETLIYSLAQFVSVPALTLFYLTETGILLQNRSSWFITAVANAGRMSLTNYLMQTFICMLLFYGYAGGLAGRVTLSESVLLAVIIYAVQLLFSGIWLRYFGNGPFEMLLRCKPLPAKKRVMVLNQ